MSRGELKKNKKKSKDNEVELIFVWPRAKSYTQTL